MSCGVLQQVTDPGCVDFCLPFGHDRTVLIRGSLLELVSVHKPGSTDVVVDGRDAKGAASAYLKLDASQSLFDRPAYATTLPFDRNARNAEAALFVAFRTSATADVRFAVMLYDERQHAFRTVSTHVLHVSSHIHDLRLDALKLRVFMESRQRCVLVQVDSAHVVVLPTNLYASGDEDTALNVEALMGGAGAQPAETAGHRGIDHALGGRREAKRAARDAATRMAAAKVAGEHPLHDASYVDPSFPFFHRTKAFVLNLGRLLKLYTVDDIVFLPSHGLTRPTFAVAGRTNAATVLDLGHCRNASAVFTVSLNLQTEETAVLQRGSGFFFNTFKLLSLHSGLLAVSSYSLSFAEDAKIDEEHVSAQVLHNNGLLLDESGEFQFASEENTHLNLDLSDCSVARIRENSFALLVNPDLAENFGAFYVCDVIRNTRSREQVPGSLKYNSGKCRHTFVWRQVAVYGASSGVPRGVPGSGEGEQDDAEAITVDPLSGHSLDAFALFGDHLLFCSSRSGAQVLLEIEDKAASANGYASSRAAVLAGRNSVAGWRRTDDDAPGLVRENSRATAEAVRAQGGGSKHDSKSCAMLDLSPEDELEYLTRVDQRDYGDNDTDPERHLSLVKQLANDLRPRKPPEPLKNNSLVFRHCCTDARNMGRICSLSTITINANDNKGTGSNWSPGFVAVTGAASQHSYLNCIHGDIPTEVRGSFQLPSDVLSDTWILPFYSEQGTKRRRIGDGQGGTSSSALTAATQHQSVSQHSESKEAKYMVLSTSSGRNLVLDLAADNGIREVPNSFLTEKNLLFCGGCAKFGVYWLVVQSGDLFVVDPVSLEPLITSLAADVFGFLTSDPEEAATRLKHAVVSANASGTRLLVFEAEEKLLHILELDFDPVSRSGVVHCVKTATENADEHGDILGGCFYKDDSVVLVCEDRMNVRRLKVLQFGGGGTDASGGRSALSASLIEVFSTPNLDQAPCVLRKYGSHAQGNPDRLRCLSAPDVDAIEDRSNLQSDGGKGARGDLLGIVMADLSVASGCEGPTLVLVQEGRPVLLYRAYKTGSARLRASSGKRATFPYEFRLEQHRFTQQVRRQTKPRVRCFPFGHGNALCVDRFAKGSGPMFIFAEGNRVFFHLGRKELLNTQPFYSSALLSDSDGADAAASEDEDAALAAGTSASSALLPSIEEFCFFSLVKKSITVPKNKNATSGADFTFGDFDENTEMEKLDVFEGEIHTLNNAVNLYAPVLRTEFALPNAPTLAAMDPGSRLCAIATTETVIEQRPLDHLHVAAEDDAGDAGPGLPPLEGVEQDGLAAGGLGKAAVKQEHVEEEDEEPVEESRKSVPRRVQKYELQVCTLQDPSELANPSMLPLNFSYPLDSHESVMCMEWASFPGIDATESVLCVGTAINLGEDLICRGRVLLFLAKDPLKKGAQAGEQADGKEKAAPEAAMKLVPDGAEPIFSKRVKGPIICMHACGKDMLAYSCGHRFCLHRWDRASGALQLVAFHDSGFCITSLTIVKERYILLGDAHNGVDLLRWYDQPGGNNSKPVKRLERLARSATSSNSIVSLVNKERRHGGENVGSQVPVLACNFILEQTNLGLVATDAHGNVHLFQYLPRVADGKEGDRVLRTSASFQMGCAVRAMGRFEKTTRGKRFGGVFMAGRDGSFLALHALTDSKFRILNTLCSHLAQKLPFAGGCNPFAKRCPAHFNGHYRKNIEDGELLNLFLFLSLPLQAAIAERIQIPLRQLVKHVEEATGTEPF